MDKKFILKAIWIPLVLALLFVIVFFVREYHLNRIDETIASEKQSFKEKHALILSISDLQNKMASLDREMDNYNSQLFTMDNAVSLVEAVAILADRYGIGLIDFRFDVPKYIQQKRSAETCGPFIVPFEGAFQGGYMATGRFMQALEKKVYIKNIYNIKISSDEISNNNVLCDIKGAIRFFDRSKLDLSHEE